MKRKIVTLIIVMIMCVSSLTFMNKDSIVKASLGGEDDIELDFNLM